MVVQDGRVHGRAKPKGRAQLSDVHGRQREGEGEGEGERFAMQGEGGGEGAVAPYGEGDETSADLQGGNESTWWEVHTGKGGKETHKQWEKPTAECKLAGWLAGWLAGQAE